MKEIVGDETNPLAKARKIFHWVDEHPYHAEEEYGVIPSFSTKALTSLKGDCGVQGLLFITMCRAAGVPARWQSGWETKPTNWNMHDWAEFYVEPWGWLPADPSYGLQKSDDPKVRDFYFGHQDSYRLIVNLDYGRTLVPAEASRSAASRPTSSAARSRSTGATCTSTSGTTSSASSWKAADFATAAMLNGPQKRPRGGQQEQQRRVDVEHEAVEPDRQAGVGAEAAEEGLALVDGAVEPVVGEVGDAFEDEPGALAEAARPAGAGTGGHVVDDGHALQRGGEERSAVCADV